ncbi:MAG TPA: SpoIIE family protein phosphatase [Micromonosporaceae bacterium]
MGDDGGTVLVVDDSRSKRYILVSWLRRAGYEVREAQTGVEALDRLAEEPVDAVVLDVRLPDISGFQVAERMKADPRWKALPVVHVSATAVHAADRTEGLERGAEAYLVEPIDPDELVATLRSVLRYSRARRQAERLATRLSRLVDVTLALNAAPIFDDLVRAAARGAAVVFDGPASAVALTPEGVATAASVTGPDAEPFVREWTGGYAGWGGPHETAPGVRLYEVDTAEVSPPWGGYAGKTMWVAVARPNANRPAAYLAIPAGSRDDHDDQVLRQLAQAVALAVEAMRSYDEERRIALTLQRSLLPRTLPMVDGYDIAVNYLPATSYAEVGGDFYEVAVVGGQVYVAIGDVAGHSLHAATIMGELRHALRAYLSDAPPPEVMLDRLNDLMLRLMPDEIATMTLLALDPATGAMRVANAGHPPMLLAEGGRVRYVDVPGPLLGVPLCRPPATRVVLPPGATLALFTDGLVERREESLDDGLERLARSATTVEDRLADFCSRLLAEHGSVHDDDVALVVVRRHRERYRTADDQPSQVVRRPSASPK